MSSQASAAAAYKAANFDNAPPLKIVQMMYAGALRFIDQAEEALEGSNGARFQERCLRVAAIVGELRLSLDPIQAPELAENLESLYRFVEGEVGNAMREDSAGPLKPAREVLATLLDGWKSLEV